MNQVNSNREKKRKLGFRKTLASCRPGIATEKELGAAAGDGRRPEGAPVQWERRRTASRRRSCRRRVGPISIRQRGPPVAAAATDRRRPVQATARQGGGDGGASGLPQQIRRRGLPTSLQWLIDACSGRTRRFQTVAAVACGGSRWRSTAEQFPTARGGGSGQTRQRRLLPWRPKS